MGEFDGGMYGVESGDEICKFVLSICPNQKKFVDVTPPYKRFVCCLV